ncbi:MAG: glycosyltransferase family 2 protein [Planctomycetes bacterium]|nr:glycosyltransferase family 2 protein [Planctomycetota bacterium]
MGDAKAVDFTLVVPVYNERDAIEQAVGSLKEIREDAEYEMEIIFVDDGSDDGTKAVLEGIQGEGIRVLSHQENRGYGAALKTGIRAAKGDVVAITDADGTYPAERLPEFLREMRENGYDMVVGARTGPGAVIPTVRRPAKWCLNKLANLLAGRKIPDINSGLRIMTKSALKPFMSILPDGFSFTTTITLAMLTSGYAVKFVPIDYKARIGRSKIRPIYDTLNFVQLICRTTLYFNPLRVFVPLSLLLVLTSVLVLVGSWQWADKIMDVSFGVILMSGVIVLTIGLLADLIDKRTR